MTIHTQPLFNEEFLVWTEDADYSLEEVEVTLSGGGTIVPGTVMKDDGATGKTPLVVGDLDVTALTGLCLNMHQITVPAAGTLAKATVLSRHAIVAEPRLTQSSGDTDANTWAELEATYGILVRTAVAHSVDATPPTP